MTEQKKWLVCAHCLDDDETRICGTSCKEFDTLEEANAYVVQQCAEDMWHTYRICERSKVLLKSDLDELFKQCEPFWDKLHQPVARCKGDWGEDE